MTTLDSISELISKDHGLAVVATLRADGSIQASLVNAGLMEHPLTGVTVAAFATYGPVKIANLRERPQIAMTFQAGWQWATIEGRAELVGPDIPNAEIGPDRLRLLLREVFTAAGGTHEDWEEYDRVMLEQRRTVVLVDPVRIYGN